MATTPEEKWTQIQQAYGLLDLQLISGKVVITPEQNQRLSAALAPTGPPVNIPKAAATGHAPVFNFPVVVLAPGASKEFPDGTKAQNVDGDIRTFKSQATASPAVDPYEGLVDE